jgi:hypothetical protein
MRTGTVFFIALILSAIGLGIFFYKYEYLEFPLTANKTYDSWYIETELEVLPQTAGQPISLDVKLPRDSDHLAIVDENIIAYGFGRNSYTDSFNNKIMQLTKASPKSREVIFYRGVLYKLESSTVEKKFEIPIEKSIYNKKFRHSSVNDSENMDSVYNAIDSVIDEAKAKAAGKESMVKELIKILADRSDDLKKERIEIIREKTGAKGDLALANLIINAAGIPSDIVTGLKLKNESGKNAELAHWLIIKIDKEWKEFDIDTLKFGLPDNYLTWWIGGDKKLVSGATGVANTETTVTVKKNVDNSLTRALWKNKKLASFLHKFSLYNLPLESQLTYQILLMIPIGGLVIAFMRQIIGIKTFGTFMPVLVALSFKETGLLHGVLFFSFIVSIGMMLRGYFHHLQLLLVPRLAGVLTIVVMLICIIGMLAHDFDFDIGLSIALFPIVILTMTIERMTIMWEETSPKDAIQTGVGSLIAATMGFLAMNSETMRHLIFTFPELLLINLAICMLLGRYNGYKLTEYLRFRKLNRQIEAKKQGSK